jgi:hypothetical protein
MTTAPERATYAAIAAALQPYGLLARGGFHPAADDAVPPQTETLVLVGNAGPDMWRAFTAAPEAQTDAHPLDRWTKRVVGAVAAQLHATAVFPSDGPPYPPFQRWAQRAEPVAPSPLGILLHPTYGLWHAYRAALLFAELMALPPRPTAAHACDSCAARPCLTACPVGAFGDAGYDVPTCVAHIGSAAGAACIERGCLARHACPVGTDYAYAPAQAAHHMRAFRRAAGTRVGARHPASVQAATRG